MCVCRQVSVLLNIDPWLSEATFLFAEGNAHMNRALPNIDRISLEDVKNMGSPPQTVRQ